MFVRFAVRTNMLADMEFQFECVLEFDRRNRTFIQHFECFFYMNTCGLPCSLYFKMADNRETSDATPTTKAKKFNWDEDDVEKLIDLRHPSRTIVKKQMNGH